MSRNKREYPGRPPGATEDRVPRPWDPTQLKQKNVRILLHIAANPDMKRIDIAEYLGISNSHLSTLTCCDAGRAFLETANSLNSGLLKNFKIPDEQK